MTVREAGLVGVLLIDLESFHDVRGMFVRAFCADAFVSAGLNATWVQTNVSQTARRGMLRGLHFQRPPSAEIKLIQCVRGSVYDVIVDVRRGSPSFGLWEAFELDATSPLAIYVPEGFAHGFQCVTDDCCLLYHMSTGYVPSLSAGVRWNDPDLAIPWPVDIPLLSERDASLPLLAELT